MRSGRSRNQFAARDESWCRLQGSLRSTAGDRSFLIGLLLWSGAFLPVSADKISTLEHAADIPSATPVLLLAGTEDRHTRLTEIEALNTRLGSRSRLILFQGASHSKLWASDRELYARSVLQFISGL